MEPGESKVGRCQCSVSAVPCSAGAVQRWCRQTKKRQRHRHSDVEAVALTASCSGTGPHPHPHC